MSEDPPPLMRELVLFNKLGEAPKPSLGTLELYCDGVVIRPGPVRRSEIRRGERWPTMSGENIPFSNINQVNGVIVGRLFKKARIRIQTELDAIWEIRTSPKVYTGLLDAFHAWKNNQARSFDLAHENPGSL